MEISSSSQQNDQARAAERARQADVARQQQAEQARQQQTQTQTVNADDAAANTSDRGERGTSFLQGGTRSFQRADPALPGDNVAGRPAGAGLNVDGRPAGAAQHVERETAATSPEEQSAEKPAETPAEKPSLWGHVKGFGKGVWDGGADLIGGVKDMAVGTYNLTGLNGADKQQQAMETLSNTTQAIIDNPMAVVDAVVEPITTPWKEGRYGEAIGRGAFEAVGVVVGTKGLDKLGKAGKLAKVADAGETVADDATSTTKAAKKAAFLPDSDVQRALEKLEKTEADPLQLNTTGRDGRDIGDVNATRRDSDIELAKQKENVRLTDKSYEGLTQKEYNAARKHQEKLENVDAVAVNRAQVLKELPGELRDAMFGTEKHVAGGRLAKPDANHADWRRRSTPEDGQGVRSGGIRESLPSTSDFAGATKERRGVMVPKKDGGVFDHGNEIAEKRVATQNALEKIEAMAERYPLSDVQRQAVSEYLDAVRDAAVPPLR